jgi:hypothetical protein
MQRTGKYIITDSGSPENLTQKQHHNPSAAVNPKLTCPSWLFLCQVHVCLNPKPCNLTLVFPSVIPDTPLRTDMNWRNWVVVNLNLLVLNLTNVYIYALSKSIKTVKMLHGRFYNARLLQSCKPTKKLYRNQEFFQHFVPC